MAAWPTTATATGGLAYSYSGGAIVERLRDIEQDNARFYLVTYEPRESADTSYRQIDIRVRRPGIKLRARAGYLPTVTSTAAAERN